MTILVNFIHKKCHWKSYHSDIKHRMTLNTILWCGAFQLALTLFVRRALVSLFDNLIHIDPRRKFEASLWSMSLVKGGMQRGPMVLSGRDLCTMLEDVVCC